MVRRNIETKSGGKKKSKKNDVSIDTHKVSKTLHETPPLKNLKNQISKYVDFES